MNKIQLKGIPLTIIGYRKAPAVWRKIAPKRLRFFIEMSFLLAPFFDGSMEKLPLKVHDWKKAFAESELRVEKRGDIREEGRKVLSLDQAELEDNESDDKEDDAGGYRDKLEDEALSLVAEIEASEEASKEVYQLKKLDVYKRMIAKYEKSTLYPGILRAVHHFLETGDVGESAKVGNINARTWYNIRRNLGLCPQDELPPVNQDENHNILTITNPCKS